jgi:hypothetical protein
MTDRPLTDALALARMRAHLDRRDAKVTYPVWVALARKGKLPVGRPLARDGEWTR